MAGGLLIYAAASYLPIARAWPWNLDRARGPSRVRIPTAALKTIYPVLDECNGEEPETRIAITEVGGAGTASSILATGAKW